MPKNKVKTCRGMLQHIRVFFEDESVDYNEHIRLWNVLAALRGPDNKRNLNKCATTSVIRLMALGDQVARRAPAVFASDSARSAAMRREMRANAQSKGSGHFYNHARAAFRALGLDWNQENARR